MKYRCQHYIAFRCACVVVCGADCCWCLCALHPVSVSLVTLSVALSSGSTEHWLLDLLHYVGCIADFVVARCAMAGESSTQHNATGPTGFPASKNSHSSHCVAPPALRRRHSSRRCTKLFKLTMGDSSSRARPHAPIRVLKYVDQPYSLTMIDRGMPAFAAPADNVPE
jgi:hypothetical protein